MHKLTFKCLNVQSRQLKHYKGCDRKETQPWQHYNPHFSAVISPKLSFKSLNPESSILKIDEKSYLKSSLNLCFLCIKSKETLSYDP